MAHFGTVLSLLLLTVVLLAQGLQGDQPQQQYRQQSKSSKLSDDNLQQQRHQPVTRIDLSNYKLSKLPPSSSTSGQLREIEWDGNGGSSGGEVAPPGTDTGSRQSKTKPTSASDVVKPARRTAKSKPNLLLTASTYTLGESEIVENLQFDSTPDVVRAKTRQPAGDTCANCVPESFLAHYRQLSCVPFVSRECGCAKYFRCPKQDVPTLNATKDGLNSNYCLYEGKRYRINEAISMPDQPCQMCQCRLQADYSAQSSDSDNNRQWKAEIDCNRITVECPEMVFGEKALPGCYFGYEHGKCCGTQICPDQLEETNIRRTHRCRYRSREYRFGEEIYPEENSCMKCLCDESWNEHDPVGSASCRPIRCSFSSEQKIREHGCTPIYTRNGCCPIDFICDSKQNQPLMTNSTDQCWLGGQSSPLGATIHVVKESTHNQFVCGSCRCQVPPLFTCKANYNCRIDPNEQTL